MLCLVLVRVVDCALHRYVHVCAIIKEFKTSIISQKLSILGFELYTMQSSSLDSKADCVRVQNDSKTELEICSFYIEVIKNIFKVYQPAFQDIRNSLTNIRSYKNPEIEVHDTVSFDEKTDRFAYIYAYCFIHSMVMFDCFSNMLKSNPTMLQKIVSMTKFRLCLLGGGAGFEAVSVCKLLSILRSKSEMKCRPFKLNIAIIDVCDGWEKDAELIISSAQREICSSSNIEIDFQFITADLTADFSEDVKNALMKSHVVVMCKFLSDVNDSCYSQSEIPQMIQKIIECISFKACLFFLDNAGGSIFKKTDKMIDEFSQTSRIYKTDHNCHMLSIDSDEIIHQSLRSIFRYLKCTKRTTISCSSWLKIRHEFSVNELSSGIGAISVDSVSNLEPHKLKDKGRKVKVKKIFQSAPKLFVTKTSKKHN